MNLLNTLKKLLGIGIPRTFVKPKKRYYLGLIKYGAPHFSPSNFIPTIFNIRQLKLRTDLEAQEYADKYPYAQKLQSKFKNLPLVRRNKEFIFKLFNKWFFLTIGFPFAIRKVRLGWKDKYETPRYEWSPMFHVYFFFWQFCIFWESPNKDSDLYYEMLLWYKNYCSSDIDKARTTWPWKDADTKRSTWNEDFIIPRANK